MRLQNINRVLIALLCCAGLNSCTSDNISEKIDLIPEKPDYNNPLMWYTILDDKNGMGADIFYAVSTWETDWTDSLGHTYHYADVWNSHHRSDMTKEISRIAEYMGNGYNFYAPFYRQTTIQAWLTQNEDTIYKMTRLPMDDIKRAFDHFLATRDNNRPFILVGFSQGGLAVVELLKYMDSQTYKNLVAAYVLGYKVTPSDTTNYSHIRAAKDSSDIGVTICYNTVKDIKYVNPVVNVPCAMCINPVNWRTDSVPATLFDTITITASPSKHVLIATGYSGSEYPSIGGVFNVGDIHSCEPWLYSQCLQHNIRLRTSMWYTATYKQTSENIP